MPSAEIAASYIKPNSLLTSFERLEIYNRQYWFRVIAAVSEDFPALKRFSARRNSTRWCWLICVRTRRLRFRCEIWGPGCPRGSRLILNLAGPQHALAVDVARLEWAYIDAFDGASLSPLGWEDFAGLGRDSTLGLQPHLQLLDLQYPVDEVVLAVRKLTPENRHRQQCGIRTPADLRRSAARGFQVQCLPGRASLRRLGLLPPHRSRGVSAARRPSRR